MGFTKVISLEVVPLCCDKKKQEVGFVSAKGFLKGTCASNFHFF